jgi:transposase
MQCMDRPPLEQLLDQGLSLAEIGKRFGLHESTVGYWVEKHGLRAVNRDKFAAKGVSRVRIWSHSSSMALP